MSNLLNKVLEKIDDFFTVNINNMSDRQLNEEMMIEISEGGLGEIYQEEIDRRANLNRLAGV